MAGWLYYVRKGRGSPENVAFRDVSGDVAMAPNRVHMTGTTTFLDERGEGFEVSNALVIAREEALRELHFWLGHGTRSCKLDWR